MSRLTDLEGTSTLSHCCSSSRFRSRYCHSLEGSESARSGELTSRLLARRSRDCSPIVFQVSRCTCSYEYITLVGRSDRLGEANQPVRRAGGNVSSCPSCGCGFLVACAINLFSLPSLMVSRVARRRSLEFPADEYFCARLGRISERSRKAIFVSELRSSTLFVLSRRSSRNCTVYAKRSTARAL